METSNHLYLDILNREYNSRKVRNPYYSKRAFSKLLGISPSRLSEIFNQKGGLSESMAKNISSQLKLVGNEAILFNSSIISIFSRSLKKREEAKSQFLKIKNRGDFRILDDSTFSLIKDWHYYALINAMDLDDYDGSALWLSRKLNLSHKLVSQSLELLLSHGLVLKSESLYKKSTESLLTTTTDIPSRVIRESHIQKMNMAIDSLEETHLEERDITAISMAIDKNKIPQAKQMIKNFRRELAEFLESGEKNEIYNLNIQLIPLKNQGSLQ